MFELSVFSTAIMYSTLGLIIGLSVSAIFFYAVTYSKIKHKNHQLRDACMLYQKQLTQLLNKNKALDIQVREAKQRWEKEHSNGGPDFENAGVVEVVDEGSGGSVQWTEERQKWHQQGEQLRGDLEQMKQEKLVLEDSLKQASERWKLEREQLQTAKTQLEAQLRGGVVPLGADTTALTRKLEDQQAAWKRAQELLQTQVGQLDRDKKALEAELVSQVNQTEREKQALEEEIELLTERMMRMQVVQEETAASSTVAGSSATS